MRRPQALCPALLAAAAVAVAGGCGGGGAPSGATVSVYAAAPLCGEARREVEVAGGRAGDLKVRVVCLARPGAGGGSVLVTAAANARRATEDSASVAYIGEPDPRAERQSRPILEAAGIAGLAAASGREAIAQLRAALRDAGSENPRQAVFDALEG